MLILKSTDNLHNADLHNVLGDIQKLADQVCWCCKDVETIDGRIDLKKLPLDLHPREIRKLYDLLHHDAILQAVRQHFAGIRDLKIESLGDPTILWMQGGGLSTKNDRISFFTVLRRPQRDESFPVFQRGMAQQKLPAEGIIDRPIAENQFVQSTFKCQAGDVIVLEGGEKIRLRNDRGSYRRDLCVLVTLNRIMRES